jgi:hypothetical protein
VQYGDRTNGHVLCSAEVAVNSATSIEVNYRMVASIIFLDGFDFLSQALTGSQHFRQLSVPVKKLRG